MSLQAGFFYCLLFTWRRAGRIGFTQNFARIFCGKYSLNPWVKDQPKTYKIFIFLTPAGEKVWRSGLEVSCDLLKHVGMAGTALIPTALKFFGSEWENKSVAQRGKNSFNFSHFILSSQVTFSSPGLFGDFTKGMPAVGRIWSRSSSGSVRNFGSELVPDYLCCFSCSPQVTFKAGAGNIPPKNHQCKPETFWLWS